MAIVNQGNWCQASVFTGTVGIRTAALVLRRAGYNVSVSSLGNQITEMGTLKMTMLSINPGSHEDTFGASEILRSHIPELRAA